MDLVQRAYGTVDNWAKIPEFQGDGGKEIYRNITVELSLPICASASS